MRALPKVAVIGANGFVGSRLVEWFHLSGRAEVVPVVRRVNALASLARFKLDWKIADACHSTALARALEGCDYVVHAMVGDPVSIIQAAQALIPAAAATRIKRVIYLSTASVHGQNPAIGSDESSPLNSKQDYAYNNAKVRAEQLVFQAARQHAMELIVLRPSVVFGPRDRWVSQITSELLNGCAWVINNGRGICNTIYVDNLIHAIDQSLTAPASATGRPYLLTDNETVTWRDLHEALSQCLGPVSTPVQAIPLPEFAPPGWAARMDNLRASPWAQRLIALTPARIKNITKGALQGWQFKTQENPWQLPQLSGPRPTPERVRLQQCEWHFPSAHARLHLGYSPPVTFITGVERTVAWLRWCGHVPPSP
jgi:nucleoside-diphosphate-sugar epimerase